MQWVKASDRKPQKKDADTYGIVLIRRQPVTAYALGRQLWIFSSRPFKDVEDNVEWLEGAGEPVDVSSTGEG